MKTIFKWQLKIEFFSFQKVLKEEISKIPFSDRFNTWKKFTTQAFEILKLSQERWGLKLEEFPNTGSNMLELECNPISKNVRTLSKVFDKRTRWIYFWNFYTIYKMVDLGLKFFQVYDPKTLKVVKNGKCRYCTNSSMKFSVDWQKYNQKFLLTSIRSLRVSKWPDLIENLQIFPNLLMSFSNKKFYRYYVDSEMTAC